MTLPLPHKKPIFGGSVVAFDDDAVMQWRKDSFRKLEGSWEATSVIKTHFGRNNEAGRRNAELGLGCWEIWISGCPAKFLQGHNLFGSSNLPSLAVAYALAVCEACGVDVDDISRRKWEEGQFTIDRVDVAQMLDVGGPEEVSDCVSALQHQAHYARRGRGDMYQGSVLWGKRSSRLVVSKAYDKAGELRSHPLHKGIPERSALEQYAVGKLRIEHEFHAKALEKVGLRKGYRWHADTALELWSEAMKALNISGQIPFNEDALKNMPRRLQKTYWLWQSGRDCRRWMSYATYKRHRKEMLNFGIDIGQAFNADYKPRVVSLSKVLQPVHAPIPAWAYGTPLLKAA